VGIPADKQQVVFESFAQADASTSRHYGGTGLGLAISARLSKLMGGRIWLDSVVGAGTTVHFTIGVEPGADAGSCEEPAPIESACGARVLVVDDNATNRKILQAMLAAMDMLPTAVDGASSAVAAMTRAWERSEPYDFLLLDLQMPGTDGYQLAEQLRKDQRFHSELMLMLSASPSSSDTQRCQELGIAAYLTKPIGRAELGRAILKALAEHEGRKWVPATEAEEPATAAASRPLRILLAEDNRVNQTLAVRLLEKQGHSVEVVADGRSALRALDAHSFDLVLMDVQMPGMDGLRATTLIRQHGDPQTRQIPIVALTAHAMNGDRERCLEAGMSGYLSKPIDSRQLYAALADLVPA